MPEWWPHLERLTMAGGTMLIIWLGYKEVWVWGKMHREQIADIRNSLDAQIIEERQDKNEWKQRFFQLLDVTSRAVKVAERGTL